MDKEIEENYRAEETLDGKGKLDSANRNQAKLTEHASRWISLIFSATIDGKRKMSVSRDSTCSIEEKHK